MGLFNSIGELCFGKRPIVSMPTQGRGHATHRGRRCAIEPLEERRLMAGDAAPQVLLGSVYFEEATGDDSRPDVIQVSFEGGAAGTTLNRLVIDGDKLGDGLSTGDIFFDTELGGLGAFGSVGLSIVSHNGFTVDSISVIDGGSQIVFTFTGFEAGEILEFSVDADEAQFVTGGTVDVNALVEGGEFQRSIMTGTFSAPHYVDLTLQNLYWDFFDPNFAAAQSATGLALDLPNDNYSPTHDFTDRTAGAVAYAAQIPLATISGWVYHDHDDDGSFDRPTEHGIGGVTVELLKDGSPTGITTTSTAPGTVGYYEFIDLLPGNYGVREVHPAGWLDGKDTHGSHGGVAGNDIITGAILNHGDDGVEYNFGELLPGSIRGTVQAHTDEDCDFDHPEILLEGVRIDLLDANGNFLRSTLTDAHGVYRFDGLAPGVYQIREHQPAGYYDGDERVGSVGGTLLANDQIGAITIGSDVHSFNYDFCEHVGVTLSGNVYHDRDDDGDFDRGAEEGIAGVVLKLLDEQGHDTGLRATTNAAGYYEFTNLAAGKYAVREVHPAGWLDGKDTAGNLGGVVATPSTADMISMIMIGWGQTGIEYNFGELLPGSIRGRVVVSYDGDCDPADPNEQGIPGVQIDLLNAAGNVIATTHTDANGEYHFDDLPPGTYAVREHQPAGYFDLEAHLGSAGGVILSTNDIGSIPLGSDQDLIDYSFCETPPGSISGQVSAHTDEDCDFDDPEILLEGVTIELRDGDGNLVATTTTDANGRYSFTNLRPGEYQVHEIQPAGYYDGDQRVGDAGGIDDGIDTIYGIQLPPGKNAIHYDFCEHVGVMLSGNVYHDRDNDGIFDRGPEEGIAGVAVKLFEVGEGGQLVDTGLRATTDAAGFYKFNNLAAGKYAVMEIHPAGWLDGKDMAGNLGGVVATPSTADMISMIMINWGEMGTEYNFGELLPGSIAGRVQLCVEFGEGDNTPIPGVRVDLLNGEGQVIAHTFTDANGEYKFTNLPPGTYSVFEHQPAEYFDDEAHVGSGGGSILTSNLIGEILVGSDVHLVDYDFCEEPPAEISGYVYIDGAPIISADALTPQEIAELRNGVRTPDDTPLASVVLMLRDGVSGEAIWGDMALPGTYADGPISIATDANGFYRFKGLRAGTYAVVQVQPGGVIDNVDHPGSLGGFAVNPDGVSVGRQVDPTDDPIPPNPSEQETIELFRLEFGENAIVRIPLPAGTNSVENNFSEVRILEPPTEVPPQEFPDPPPQPFVFGAGGFPFVPTLFVPPPLPIRAPEYFGGSAKALGYTWHLSVVNAGQPRSVKEVAALFQLTASLDVANWHDVPLDGGRWTLARFEGGNVSILREEVFGHAKARPVAGDFNGDGVWEIGVWIDGHWYLDLNANGRWDEGDLWAHLGSEADLPVTGDWDDDGKTDIGIFGPAWPRDPWAIRHEPGLPDGANHPTRPIAKQKNVPPVPEEATSGGRVLKRTAQGKPRTDLIDHVFHYGAPGDRPITGDWNGDGIRAIGVFRDGQWSLDLDGDGRFTDADASFAFGQAGDLPVIGDFNGDGVDEVGVYRNGQWIIDTNGNRQIDAYDTVFALGGAEDVPVVGDWDGDGVDDPGTYRPTEPQDRLSRRAG